MFSNISAVYDKLWNEAAAAFARGEPQIDPLLSQRTTDLRRCVTLVLRLSPAVQTKVREYLERLAAVCPEQYYYRPEELHVTVLSIISGSELWRKEMRALAACRPILSEVLSRQHAFKIVFKGVTASPGSVLIQGFPTGDGLAKIRDDLREAFARGELGDMLDRRYKITAAHITAMRFQKPLSNLKRLSSLLEEGRQLDFGETEVSRLQLIWCDWYAVADSVRTLQEYRLRD
jgi:2'-5' RNA ligase